MSCVPLPWWTSMSMMATRSSPDSRAFAAATLTLLKRQKPIARSGVAWGPGGGAGGEERRLSPRAAPGSEADHRGEQAAFIEVRHDRAQPFGALGVAAKLVFEVQGGVRVADAGRGGMLAG